MSRTRNEIVEGPARIPELGSEAPRKSTFRKFKDRLRRAPPPSKEAGKLEGQNAESKPRPQQTLQPVAEGVQLNEEEFELQVQPQRRTRSRSFSFITRHLSKSKGESGIASQTEAPVRPSTSPKPSTENVKEHVAVAKTARTKSPPLPAHAREQLSKYGKEAPIQPGRALLNEHTKPPNAEPTVPSKAAQAEAVSKPAEDPSAQQKPSSPVNVEPTTTPKRLQAPPSQPSNRSDARAENTPPKIVRASPASPNHTSRFTEEGLTEQKLLFTPDLADFTKHDSATFSTAETTKTDHALTHSREISDSSVHPSTAATSVRDSREHTENEDYQRFLDQERIRLEKVTAYEGKIFSDAVAEAAERATKRREMEAKQQKGMRRNKSVKETLKREMSLSQKSTISRTLSKSSRAIGNYIRPAPTPEGLERIGDQIIDSEGQVVVLTNDGPMVVPSRSDTRGSKASRKLEPTLEQKRGHRRGGSKDMPISPALLEDEN